MRTYLHRHIKNCLKKSQTTDSKHAQANGLTLLQELKWSKELQCNSNNATSVRKLTEALLAHVILLNRKRSGEAQRIKR